MREAQKTERDTLVARDGGTLLKPNKTTIADLLDQWVKTELPRTVKLENREAYEIVIEKYLKPRFGEMQVRALTVEALEGYYADLQEQGRSTSLIQKCHMRMGSALRMAKRYGMVNTVVTEGAKVPKVQYGQKEIWTLEEVRAFLVVAAEDGMHPIWRLAVESGARTSELLGVRWTDLEAKAGTIRFGRQVVRLDHGHPIIREGGKTAAAERTIPITPDLVDGLKAHRKAQNEKRLAAPEWTDNGLVFATRSGRPYNARFFRKHFDGICKDSGVANIGPHGMRRTAITLAIANGANIKAVSGRVGHADVATTIGIYQRVTRGMDDQLLDIMGSIAAAKPPEGEAVAASVASLPDRADAG
jgi:integrase